MIFQLDDLEQESIKEANEKGMIFTYQGDDYYFKKEKRKYNYLYEVIASKIAKRMNISCCEYYIGEKNHRYGAVSKRFDTTTYSSMNYLLKDFYKTQIAEVNNNLEAIDNFFYQKFGKEIQERLMDDLVNIFLFDVIIGNSDRHSNNYGLVKTNDNIEFAPLFDNENMLSRLSLLYGFYALGVDEDDFVYNFYFMSSKNISILYKFLERSSYEYLERLEKFLPAIDRKEIINIFEEIEEEIEIDGNTKRQIIQLFQVNKNYIESECQKTYKKE